MKRAGLFLFALLLTTAASAQPRRNLEDGASGQITFHSVGQSRATILSATLTLPAAAARPAGAVIILDDLPGASAEVAQLYAPRLVASGAAVLTIDSFAARGLREPEAAAGLASLRQVEDAYAALSILRTHPAIAPTRIALLGLGRGGVAAIEASLSPLREIARGDALLGGVAFAAIVAQYPSCALQWRPVESIGKPLLIQLGALDDLAGVGLCEDYARRLRQGNPAGVTLRIYPGLPAAWEARAFERPEADRLDRCSALLDLDGALIERSTGMRHIRGQIAAFFERCRLKGRRGGGGDPESAARAFIDLAGFLEEVGVGR